MNLRPYQLEAIEAIRQHIRDGKKRVLLVAPTGAGKTVIAGAIIHSANTRQSHVLAIAHRRELIEQLSARLTRENVSHGIIMGAATHSPHERVQVASIQTLRRHPRKHVDLIFIDEGHHAVAKSYRSTLEPYPDAVVVGLTASPWRLDNRGMEDVYQASVVAATPAELISEGYLCNYDGRSFQAPDISNVGTVSGDFDPTALSLAYTGSTVFGDIIDKWQQYSRHRQTIVFAASVANSLALVEKFRAIGVTAEHVDYNTAAIDRFAILDRVRRGITQVICNVQLLTEGVDIPNLKCVILARPTQSLALHLQMMGRVMRPVGDEVAWIHDHAENCKRLGLPDTERDYSLTATKPKVPRIHECEECFAAFENWDTGCTCQGCQASSSRNLEAPPPDVTGLCCVSSECRGRVCPGCGIAAPKISREAGGPTEVAEHTEVTMADLKRSAEEYKRELFQQALEFGYKPGWAVHKFLKRFPGSAKPWKLFREIKDAQSARG